VNAYTGHSNNTHTAATSYFHLNSKWVGHAIASSALAPAVFVTVDPVVARNNAESGQGVGGIRGERNGYPWRAEAGIPDPSPTVIIIIIFLFFRFFFSFIFPHEGL
jgi:hypothetical protein